MTPLRGVDSYHKPLASPPVAPSWHWRPFQPRQTPRRPRSRWRPLAPIFALIEEYRAAAKTAAAAASELSRREEMLLEQGLGTCPFISVLNPSGTPSQEPTTVYTHEYIDRLIPPERFSKRNAKAHASLDARREQRNTIMGDSEEVLYAAQDAETEAVDELVWTPPKTIAGVLALLELWPELRRSRVLDDDQTDAITISVADALRGIHQLPEAGATVIPVVQA